MNWLDFSTSARSWRRLRSGLMIAAIGYLLSGCASNQGAAGDGESQTTVTGARERFQVSSNQIVGEVLHVDALEGIAVVHLSGDLGSLSQPLLARDLDLQPTAILKPSAYVRKRTLGVTIADGDPQPGDEVVLPGPTYRAMIQERLKPGSVQKTPQQATTP